MRLVWLRFQASPALSLRLMAVLFLCRPADENCSCSQPERERERGGRPGGEREFIRICFFRLVALVFRFRERPAARVGLGSPTPTPTTTESGSAVPPGLDKNPPQAPRPGLYAHPPNPTLDGLLPLPFSLSSFEPHRSSARSCHLLLAPSHLKTMCRTFILFLPG